MAEKLKRDFDIVVLKTELVDAARDGNDVRFTLQYKVDGELTNAASWASSTSAIGLVNRRDNSVWRGSGPPLQLPEPMLDELRAWFEQETEGNRPLWVHLVRPYAALRFVPWERLLGERIGVPILMLPDFIFPPPRETKAALEVVLCGSAPLGVEHHWVREAVGLSVERILEAAVRRTRIHVFTDKDIAADLLAKWAGTAFLGTDVVINDHSQVAPYVVEDPSSRVLDHTGVLRSPWLIWMRDALRNRAVDVVHFACHGYMTRDRGAMLFAQSPLERTDRYLAGPVGGAELHTFLTQVGAWSTVFTSPFDNHSEPGLRGLADELAQNRPGPLMMISMGREPQLEALTQGYRFLYADELHPPPASTALFVYCQPYRTPDAMRAKGRTKSVATLDAANLDMARNVVQRQVAARADAASPLDSLFLGTDNVEPWVAATQRFAEQVQLRYQQIARDELAPVEQCEHDSNIAQQTIDDLRRAVAAQAANKRGSSGGGAR
jgi:hypothetical protein